MENQSKIQNPKLKIVIIGGGLSGLATAFRLHELKSQKEFDGDFLLLEAGARLGGTIQSEFYDGFLLEGGADSFLSQKTAALDLARKLKLENELTPTRDEFRRSFLVRANRLRALPPGFQLIAPSNVPAFFASEILSAAGKMRLANERFLPAAAPQTDESLADFARRRFGREALERIAQPMFAGIYTADPEKLSIKATQPRFLELEQRFGSVIAGLEEQAKQAEISSQKFESGAGGVRYNLFLSFKNGMQTLLDGLIENLPPQIARTNSAVRNLHFDAHENRWRISLENNEIIEADAICLALSARHAADLLRAEFPALAQELASIEYASTATINFGFERAQILHPLDGFGFVVPFVERRALLAATFSSVKFANRAPAGKVLIRAFVGGALQPEMFALDDREMIERALQDLRSLVGAVGAPLFARAARWANSMPQYHVGHLAKVERISRHLQKIPTLQFATNAFYGVGVPDVIKQGETAANNLARLTKSETRTK